MQYIEGACEMLGQNSRVIHVKTKIKSHTNMCPEMNGFLI